MSAVRTAGRARDVMPTLCLDIDDVICMSSPYGGFDAIAAVNDRHVNPEQVYQGLFLTSAVRALKRIHDEMQGGIQYVISSTWRESFSRAQLAVVFRRAGLGFVADRMHEGEKWRTPPQFGRSQRINEIAEWLDRHHQGESFAIVDDTFSGASLMPALMPASNVPAPAHSRNEPPHPFAGRVVLCKENIGLTGDHVAFIVAALRRPVPMPSVPK